MENKFIKLLILIFLLFTLAERLWAKEKMPAFNNKISLSFSDLPLRKDYWYSEQLLGLQFEYHRSIYNGIYTGIYSGIGLFEEFSTEFGDRRVSLTYEKISNSYHYGLSSQIQILQIIKKERKWIDLYFTGKCGYIFLASSLKNNIYPINGLYFDYSLMGGCSIYFSKKLGFFAEAGYRNYTYHKGYNMKFGLSYRF